VPVRSARGQWSLWIGGAANKNRDVFEQRFRHLSQRIETEVRAGEKAGVEAAACMAGD